MNVKELKALAKERGIKRYYRLYEKQNLSRVLIQKHHPRAHLPQL